METPDKYAFDSFESPMPAGAEPESGDLALGNELANTPFPPPGTDPKQAAAQLAFLKTMTHEARVFYEADRYLGHEDRVNIYKAFRHQMYSQYIGAGVGLAVGIQAPRWICRYLGRAWPKHYSSLTGLLAFVAGYSGAERWSVRRSQAKYRANERYTTVLTTLQKYPPVVGYSYYMETVSRPDSRLPDPSRFDWLRYPPFPIVLTTFRIYNEDPNIKRPSVKSRDAQNAFEGSSEEGDSQFWNSGARASQVSPEWGAAAGSRNAVSASEEAQYTSAWDRLRRPQNKTGATRDDFKWEYQNPRASQEFMDQDSQPQQQQEDLFVDPFEDDSK